MVMAAGSVMNEPSSGPTVRIVSHQALKEPPNRPATRPISASESLRIGRVAASVMITTTNIGSVKLTPWER